MPNQSVPFRYGQSQDSLDFDFFLGLKIWAIDFIHMRTCCCSGVVIASDCKAMTETVSWLLSLYS